MTASERTDEIQRLLDAFTRTCVCGHDFYDHHDATLFTVDEMLARPYLRRPWVGLECEAHGSNEDGRLAAEGHIHCRWYVDRSDAVLEAVPEDRSDLPLVTSNRVRLEAARAELLAELGTLKAPQAGALIAVTHGGKTQYPQFQFDAAGAPLPEVSQVLEGLGEKARPWDVLVWFTEPNEHLEGRAPLHVWTTDRELVVDAACRANWFVRD